MYAGAAVQAISVIVSLATIHSLKTIIEQRNPTFDATRVNRLVDATVVLVIVFGLIGIGLWLWMAWANRRGRSWARIVSTVFFGLASIGLLIGFTQAATVVSRIISIVSWAIGLAAVVFLWQRQSSDYYDARKQAVYAPLPYGQPGPPGQPYGQPPYSQPGQPPYSQPGQQAYGQPQYGPAGEQYSGQPQPYGEPHQYGPPAGQYRPPQPYGQGERYGQQQPYGQQAEQYGPPQPYGQGEQYGPPQQPSGEPSQGEQDYPDQPGPPQRRPE